MDVNGGGIVDSEEKRQDILTECLEVMSGLWRERQALPPRPDLISMMAHDLLERPMEFLGNLVLLRPIASPGIIVMGNINPGVEALNVPRSVKVTIEPLKGRQLLRVSDRCSARVMVWPLRFTWTAPAAKWPPLLRSLSRFNPTRPGSWDFQRKTQVFGLDAVWGAHYRYERPGARLLARQLGQYDVHLGSAERR
jgi:hypothetical protein